MDTATEARIVELIDRALVDVSRAHPGRTELLDALLDVRLGVLELAVFDWIESEGSGADPARPKRNGLVGLKKHPS